MAKKSYLSFYKEADKARMLGRNAGEPQKSASPDPDVRLAKRESREMLNPDRHVLHPEAYKWWKRKVTPPAYTGREPYVIGENIPFEEFARFYDFYNSDKNPYNEPEEWGEYTDEDEALRLAGTLPKHDSEITAKMIADNGGTIAGMKRLLKKGNPMAGRKWSMKNADLWLSLNPPGPDTVRGAETAIAEQAAAPGESSINAPLKTDRPDAGTAPVPKGKILADDREALRQKLLAQYAPKPKASEGVSNEEARARLERILLARKVPTISGAHSVTEEPATESERQALLDKEAQRKAQDEIAIQKQWEEEDKIKKLSDEEILNEVLKATRRPGDFNFQRSAATAAAADKKEPAPKWLKDSRAAEKSGKSIQELEQEKYGYGHKVRVGQKAQKHLENRDDRETKEILTHGVKEKTGKKELSESLRASLKKRGLSDAQIERGWKAGVFEEGAPAPAEKKPFKPNVELVKKSADKNNSGVVSKAEFTERVKEIGKKFAMGQITEDEYDSQMAELNMGS